MISRNASEAFFCFICLSVGLVSGFALGHLSSPDINPPTKPITLSSDLSASLNLTIINVANIGKTITVLIIDEKGNELFSCSTYAPCASSSLLHPINVTASWKNVTAYDNSTFTIIVNARKSITNPTTETREIEWTCHKGLHDTTVITFSD